MYWLAVVLLLLLLVLMRVEMAWVPLGEELGQPYPSIHIHHGGQIFVCLCAATMFASSVLS